MNVRNVLIGGGFAAAVLVGGAFGATVINPAGAATGTTTPSSTPATDGSADPTFPTHGTAAHEGLEKPVTGDAATKAKAAAVAAVSGGTAGAVTTNVSGDGYEVTVTKTDGSQVEVRLDSSFTAVEDGHEGHDGDGGHGRGCDHDGGDHDGDAPAAPSTSTSSSSSSSSSST